MLKQPLLPVLKADGSELLTVIMLALKKNFQKNQCKQEKEGKGRWGQCCSAVWSFSCLLAPSHFSKGGLA